MNKSIDIMQKSPYYSPTHCPSQSSTMNSSIISPGLFYSVSNNNYVCQLSDVKNIKEKMTYNRKIEILTVCIFINSCIFKGACVVMQ